MSEENNNMVKVHSKNRHYCMDRWLVDNLDQQKDLIRYNNDFVYIVDGRTGSGKTHFIVNHVAIYLDPEFTPEKNICYDVESFEDKLENLPKYSVIVVDESFFILAGRKRMSKEVIRMIDNLMTSRIYNKFIFLILPSAKELDSYVKNDRAICLIRCYYGKGLKRGNFMYYNFDRMRKLFSNNNVVRATARPNFFGNFSSKTFFDMEKLDLHKREQLKARQKKYAEKSKA